MKNRVTVTIGGQKYTLLAAEDAAYVEKIAAYVDGKLSETARAGKISAVDCAVLTAMNIAEEKLREQEASENLRAKIKELLEESASLKMELSECKRKIFKLEQRK